MNNTYTGLLVLAAVLGINGLPVQRIVNGTDTTIEAIPFQVSLQFYGQHSCGGVILNAKTVLTAAHCLEYINEFNPVSALSIRIGSSFLHRDGQVIDIREIRVHEQYNPSTYDFDVALLYVATPLTFSAQVQPAKLPSTTTSVQTGEIVQVSGWGRLSVRLSIAFSI